MKTSLLMHSAVENLRVNTHERSAFVPVAVRARVTIGKPVPRLDPYAVVDGEYRRLDFSIFDGRWIALCFPSEMETSWMVCLDRQRSMFEAVGAALIAVVSDHILLEPRFRGMWAAMKVPLLTDPLHRIRRAYGVATRRVPSKTQIFLIDAARILRHQVMHELTDGDMDVLLRLIFELTASRGPALFKQDGKDPY